MRAVALCHIKKHKVTLNLSNRISVLLAVALYKDPFINDSQVIRVRPETRIKQYRIYNYQSFTKNMDKLEQVRHATLCI